MSVCNQDLRREIKQSKVKQWEISEVLGIHFTTLTCWLRKELPETEKAKIREAIKVLKEGEQNAANPDH